MANKASEKIIDALSQLIEGFNELQESIESDFTSEQPDEEYEEGQDVNTEIDAGVVNEMRAALEAVIDAEDVSPEEIASMLSSLTEALEEIDPEVFEGGQEGEEDEEAYEEDEEYYDEDEDLDEDLEDLDEDYDEDEEEEDDEEFEDDEEEEEEDEDEDEDE